MVIQAHTDSQITIHLLFWVVADHKSVLIGHFLVSEELSGQVSGKEMSTTGKTFSYGPVDPITFSVLSYLCILMF